MIKNYLLVAIRNFRKGKVYSFINLLGLAVGMTCCFLILIFVRDELSYDHFQKKLDRLYRITYIPKFAGMEKGLPTLSIAAAPLLKDYFPGIETSARLFRRSATIQKDITKTEERQFFFGDSTLLDIFTFHFLQGDSRHALTNPSTVILSASAARRYFGDTPAVGQSIRLDGDYPLLVTGVFADFPDNSHVHIDLLASYPTMFATITPEAKTNLDHNWIISHSSTYVLLKPGQAAAPIDKGFAGFIKAHAPKEFARDIVYHLQPVRDIHLRSDLLSEIEPVGSITQVYIFGGIALVTLVIAGINFVNLSTARSLRRAKEVGMRKVLGAERKQLIFQFLAESLALSFLAFLASIVLLAAFLPVFNDLADKHFIFFDLLRDGKLWLGLLTVFLLAGLLAGLYPAFFISAFEPVTTLKGDFAGNKGRGGLLRKTLLVVQFSASMGLMIATLIMFGQLNFLQAKPLGFEKENTLVVPVRTWSINSIFNRPNDSLYHRLQAFREKVLTNPDIKGMTLSDQQPGLGVLRRGVLPQGFSAGDNLFALNIRVDYNFIPTYGMQMAAGRNFSEAYGSDKDHAFVINETAVRRFHFGTPDQAIGKTISLIGKRDVKEKEGIVVGVVRDFYAESLYSPIDALVMDVDFPSLTSFSIKIRADRTKEAIAFLQRNWDAWFPGKDFQFSFLDKTLGDQYTRDQKQGRVIGYFCGLAIFVSCLGLLGLIALIGRQRAREIGIRKVLGATATGVVILLSKDFIRLILVAIVLATPVAVWVMHRWLMQFAYHIDISWWMIALSAAGMVGIAMLTLCLQAVRAALVNPLKSLRSE
ncbi:MAG TPA: ABC transporter permease [Puia sp.]|uniref:ABC transporter permease n=1 Tax=Puia sp. TaxID=2045100 RepID=UPI002C2F5DB1|nr:ABC transporter permease [Puia sp.]HVU93584.1 ABC transporter permease [Puia sp.]